MSEREDKWAAAGLEIGHVGWSPDFKRAVKLTSSLYVESGGDPSRCEFCDELLDDSQSWKRGLDGAGAHLSCLRAHGVRV